MVGTKRDIGGAAVLAEIKSHVCSIKNEWHKHWSSIAVISLTLTFWCSSLPSSPMNYIG